MKKRSRRKQRTTVDEMRPFQGRLTNYCLAAGALLASGSAAEADIVYYDFSASPPSASNSDLYFNLSGQTSASNNGGWGLRAARDSTYFSRQGYYTTISGSTTFITTRNAYTRIDQRARGITNSLGYFAGGSNLYQLASGSSIANSRPFTGAGLLGRYYKTYAGPQSYGLWSPFSGGFLGLNFVNVGTHYGWAQLSLGDDYSINLLAFAYETEPDTPIKAGQTFDALSFERAVSRKNHGGTDFDLDLLVAGGPAVECREPTNANATIGPRRPRGTVPSNTHNIVFFFSTNMSAVAPTDVEITGNASLSGVSTSGKTVTVELTDVADAQLVTVKLKNLSDTQSDSQTLAAVSASVYFLLGDTTGNKLVNASDVAQTKSKSGVAASATSFRTDVNLSGITNSADVAEVKSRSGAGIPAAPISAKTNRTGIAPR